MPAGSLPTDGCGGDNEVADLKGIIYSAAHPEHDHRLEIVQVGQTVYNQSSLGRTDAKIYHRTIHGLCVDNAKIAFVIISLNLFMESVCVPFEVRDNNMIAKIFQRTICVSFQSLSDVFVFL
jgi:hypothetical protein